MLLNVRHTTRYTFNGNVLHGLQRLRLQPKSTHGQKVLDWHMTLSGAGLEVAYEDQHRNHVDLISILSSASELTITCEGKVSTKDNHGIVGEHIGKVPLWSFVRPTPLTQAGPNVRSLLAQVDADQSDMLSFLHALSRTIQERVEYVPGSTSTATTAEDALALGKGVCQDHAHIFIAAGRALDVPMRYVSGYLRMDDRVDQDAGHAWAEAYIHNIGWVGFDVSNGICPDERYIRVATGCDYQEAAPVTGIASGAGDTHLDVALSVAELAATEFQQQVQSSHQ